MDLRVTLQIDPDQIGRISRKADRLLLRRATTLLTWRRDAGELIQHGERRGFDYILSPDVRSA